MSNKAALREAIKLMGSQAKLACVLGVSRQRVNHWLNRDDTIPYTYALAIEKVTKGKVTHQQLLLSQFDESITPSNSLPITLEYLSQQQISIQQEVGNVSKTMRHILSVLQSFKNADK